MLLNLVDEQAKLGLQPTIGSIGENGVSEKPFETAALHKGFEVEKFRMRPGPNYFGAYKILKYVHQNGFDLIHSHGYKGNILLGLIPKKLRKIPMISTLHGWTHTQRFSKMRIYALLDCWSLTFVDAVVLVNESMKNHLGNRSGINQYVVNNGISLTDKDEILYSPNNRILADAPDDGTIVDFCNNFKTIGAIGRLSPEKGYINLIKSFKIVSKNFSDTGLVIIGEGSERKILEKEIKELGLTGKVLLPGYRKKARKYIPYFNIFAITSTTEGLPITLLETMLAGVPVVSTQVGGIPEVLANGKAGLLLDSPKVEDIAIGVTRLLENPGIGKNFAQKAQDIVKQKYSSHHMAQQYFNIYNHILGGV